MYHPTTRVLTVLELLQAHGRLSGAEIASRLEVDLRTVRRYITMLQDLGLPVESERGRYGGYRLRPGFRLPPLMLSDEEALALTKKTGYATFFSRSRNKLWLKGESSGHRLIVKEIRTDCDEDCVLVQVEAIGPGVCHEGFESCFFRELKDGRWTECDSRAYDPKGVYGESK